jgi:iron complex outermembrane receptor protein
MRQVPATLSSISFAVAALAAQAQTSTPSTPSTPQAPEAAASAPAAEPAPTGPVQQIITTGTRAPKAVDKIPGAITVVSKEEVQRTLLLTEDATAVLARTVPGYAESSQAMSNTGETLRGRIALRLFDGVPQGSPLREGNRQGTFTDMGVVGRIEVINGPSAAEGIGAAGGIINYISKTATKPGDEFTLSTRYSSQFHDDSASWKLGGTWARKLDDYDLFLAASHVDRGITYDGHGRRIGPNTSGSVADSKSDNFFGKVGFNFGAADAQRIQVGYSNFKITGKGNYILVDGDRATGTTNTAERGQTLGAKTEFNDFEQVTASYRHNDFAGGTLTADLYFANQQMRFPPEDGDDRQDPLIVAPPARLVDQSEIHTRKKGLRTAWARPDFLAQGLELRTGVDLVQDTAEQRLALTGRLWVPPMVYKSIAPYAQLSYDLGPLTLSGGYRREDGKLTVDTYTTTFFRNRVLVTGGSLDYTANLPNAGIVWRFAPGWSAFASYSKGFTLPNVGIPLRNINKPGQSVEGILDLQAIIVDNKEVGVTWRGRMGSLSASVYESKSDLGVSLSVDPVTNDFVMNRAPVRIRGLELAGELLLSKAWKANAVYSHIEGRTTFVKDGPLDKEMGVNDINPDKLAGSVTWSFWPNADVTLGATKLFSRDLNVGTTAEERTTGYTLWDLSANLDTRVGKFSLGVENLTNRFYILSWSQVPGFRNYWAGRGRVTSLTYTVTF